MLFDVKLGSWGIIHTSEHSPLEFSTKLLYRGKSAQQLSYGFNILDELESCPNENKIPYGHMDFLKKVSKVIDFRW